MSTYEVTSQVREGDAFHLVVRVTNDEGVSCPYGYWLTDEQNAAVLADPEAMLGIGVKVAASAILYLEALTPTPAAVKAEPAELAALDAALTPERVEERVTEVREVLVYAERLVEEGRTEEEIVAALREREAAWDAERVGEPVRELAGTVTR